MLMTHIAIMEAEESKPHRFERFARRLAEFFGLIDDTDKTIAPHSTRTQGFFDAPTEPVLRIVPRGTDVDDHSTRNFRWRRHPQLLDQKDQAIPDNERDARHDAVRGLFAARAGALECAESHFARAAACDEIDLSAIPGFWQLDRSAMMTAVEAYERAGRIRDASALNARIRTMYRPRSLSPVPANVRHFSQSATKVSSSS